MVQVVRRIALGGGEIEECFAVRLADIEDVDCLEGQEDTLILALEGLGGAAREVRRR